MAELIGKLNAPDFDYAKRSSVIIEQEREMRLLVSYIKKLEGEQRVLCEHIKEQSQELATLKDELHRLKSE